MVIEELFTRLGFQVDPKGIDKAKSSLEGFKKWVGGLAIGAGLSYLAKTGIDAAMSMESLTAQFTVMTGSAERANAVLSEIADFAAKTPFTKLGLADAGKTLMAFGIEGQKIVPTLRMLGDVAGADQNKLKSLALVFGQIQSTGKLMGQDLLQLINQGFNPLNVISEQTGISMAKLKDAMAQGAISADMVTAAFQAATSEGGLFFGNLEAQSQTLQGRLSTLQDNFQTALQNMAEAFLPLLKAGTDVLIAFDWTPIIASMQSVAEKVTSLVGTIGSLVSWAQKLSPLLILIFGPKLIAMIGTAIKSTRLYAGALTFVERAHLASGAAANYQLTATGLLSTAMYTASTAAKTLGASMKAAFMAALSPMNVLLVGLAGIKELYDYFYTKAGEELKQSFEQQDIEEFLNDMLSPEAQVEMSEKVRDTEKKKYLDMLWDPQKKASKEELKKQKKEYESADAQYKRNVALYKAARGIEWTTYQARKAGQKRTGNGAVSTPGMSGGAADFKSAFDDLKKAIKDSENATKKQTKATEDNTRAQQKFDISALSRQAFDAAFNVKLRDLTLGAI
jgi:tape measure domain-containing protein